MSELLKALSSLETPLPLQELNYISDLQRPAASKGQGGLLQMISEPTVRGRGRLRECWVPSRKLTKYCHVSDRLVQGFPYVKPEVSKKAKQALLASLVHGMDEDLFYKTFVQCFVCKDVVDKVVVTFWVSAETTLFGLFQFREVPPKIMGFASFLAK